MQPASFLHTGPHNILGLEINEFAAELARVTVWIGDIQWCRQNGYPHAVNPILKPLDGIERRDALLAPDNDEATWPATDVIVGNPPFLGDKIMRGELGDDYVDALRKVYRGRVPGGADLVTYWFEKARAQIDADKAKAVGLVATNSIRQKRNRVVLERVSETCRIFEAWSDEPWVNDGAAVRVSLVAFGKVGGASCSPMKNEREQDAPTSIPSPPNGGRGLGRGGTPTAQPQTFPALPAETTSKETYAALRAEGCAPSLAPAGALSPAERGRAEQTAAQAERLSPNSAREAAEIPDGQGRGRILLPQRNEREQDAPATLTARLDGRAVAVIHADLTAGEGLDLTRAQALSANREASFFGLCLAGKFKVETAVALAWLHDTGNPNGKPNSDVLRPIYNGSDITRRWAGHWVIDFANMDMATAADYLQPFAWVEAEVKPVRAGNNEARRVNKWWIHGRNRPLLRAALLGKTHYIATPETAKHRFFVRFPVAVAPEHSLIVIPRGDALTLGLLSSRIHCVWALGKGGRMGVGNDPRYNASLTFETFPFPEGFSPRADAPLPEGDPWRAISEAARQLEQWRENWLNPPDWITAEITPEEAAAGFPPRIQPKPANAAAWKKRTLTKLYNENPPALRLFHQTLDKAVATAYGWSDYTPDTPDEEILKRLLQLNLEASRHDRSE